MIIRAEMVCLFAIMDQLETIVAAAGVRIGHDLVASQVDMALELLLLHTTSVFIPATPRVLTLSFRR
jgi:hypothetical protein